MPIFKWIRDLFGIRKDLIEVKKTKLEIKQLKDEQREPDIIEKADIEDIKRYDPKMKELKKKIIVREKIQCMSSLEARPKRRLLLPILIVIFLILLFLFLTLNKVFP